MKQKDRFKNFDDEVRELVLSFENTILKGKSQFFDVDEMEIKDGHLKVLGPNTDPQTLTY